MDDLTCQGCKKKMNSHHRCYRCGGWFCSDCFDTATRMCLTCEKEGRRI